MARVWTAMGLTFLAGLNLGGLVAERTVWWLTLVQAALFVFSAAAGAVLVQRRAAPGAPAAGEQSLPGTSQRSRRAGAAEHAGNDMRRRSVPYEG